MLNIYSQERVKSASRSQSIIFKWKIKTLLFVCRWFGWKCIQHRLYCFPVGFVNIYIAYELHAYHHILEIKCCGECYLQWRKIVKFSKVIYTPNWGDLYAVQEWTPDSIKKRNKEKSEVLLLTLWFKTVAI